MKMLGLIRRRGECSRGEIGRYFDWSPAWCTSHLKPLLEQQILVQSAHRSLPPGGRGRRNQHLIVNSDYACAFGVNVGFERITIGLVNLDGCIVERGQVLAAHEQPLDIVAGHIKNEIERISALHPAGALSGRASPLPARSSPMMTRPCTARRGHSRGTAN